MKVTIELFNLGAKAPRPRPLPLPVLKPALVPDSPEVAVRKAGGEQYE